MNWYEEDVQVLEKKIAAVTYEPELVFYGSSSIRQWDELESDFADYAPLNLGFGGSTLEACVLFFNRIFKTIEPKGIIVYAGDNDLGDGKRPEDVFFSFKKLVSLVRERYHNIPLAFISIKPSFERWKIIDKIRLANKLIENEIIAANGNITYINVHDSMLENGLPNKAFFDDDGLHINENGYRVWKEAINAYLNDRALKPNYITQSTG